MERWESNDPRNAFISRCSPFQRGRNAMFAVDLRRRDIGDDMHHRQHLAESASALTDKLSHSPTICHARRSSIAVIFQTHVALLLSTLFRFALTGSSDRFVLKKGAAHDKLSHDKLSHDKLSQKQSAAHDKLSPLCWRG